ncbi:hypothetical protein L195_g062670, partial [Trifolium pratense]
MLKITFLSLDLQLAHHAQISGTPRAETGSKYAFDAPCEGSGAPCTELGFASAIGAPCASFGRIMH